MDPAKAIKEIKSKTLHSNLVIFKCGEQGKIKMVNTLYIPIWLYSNAFEQIFLLPMTSFTFQSGYIQMRSKLNALYAFVTFTFQSGYIQIKTFTFIKRISSLFTFQSGYIQIHLRIVA